MSDPLPKEGAQARLPWLWMALTAMVLGLHAVQLFSTTELVAGGDLPAHLRLMQLTEESFAIRNVYPPAYHVFGAALGPWVGWSVVPKLFALLSVGLLLFGFRAFQRAAGLPDTVSEAFTLLPYSLAASVCAPKIEFAAIGLMMFGLAALLTRRYAALAVLLCLSFYVHSAASLTFGFVGGALALSNKDGKALLALAFGTLGALPLLGAHTDAGCTLPQALLMSYSGYLPSGGYGAVSDLRDAAPVAGPVLVLFALAGGAEVWRRHPRLVLPCVALIVLYLQPVWMPWITGSHGVGLYRGLTLLLLPTAIGAGVFLAPRRRLHTVAMAASTVWLLVCATVYVPRACGTAPIDLASIEGIQVARCEYAWSR